jgi:Domain of unknown function (DUF4126)
VAPLSGTALTSFLVATSFAAGLNAYATVAALGLLARAGVLALPSSLAGLQDWTVIAAAVALFAIEFVADKIPVFDLVWNTLHTFVRVPVAALLAFNATAQLPLDARLWSTILGAAIALIAHTGKTAARVAVTPSPEPFSNIALSLGEDLLAVWLTWLAARHPYLAATIALVCVAIIVLSLRAVVRLVGRWLAQRRERTTPMPRP